MEGRIAFELKTRLLPQIWLNLVKPPGEQALKNIML